MNEYAKRCLQRAIESGHYAWVREDGSILVASDSEKGIARRVTFVALGDFIQFDCTCPAGKYHAGELVPCKHSAVAGRRLVREGLAIYSGGIFCVAPKQEALIETPKSSNPLVGLPTA